MFVTRGENTLSQVTSQFSVFITANFVHVLFSHSLTIIKHIDAYRRYCLWRGSNNNNKKPAQADWPLVCSLKSSSGLGVIQLQTQKEALLLKKLYKCYNKEDIPWVQLIWEILQQ
jgi:hypothetical protein